MAGEDPLQTFTPEHEEEKLGERAEPFEIPIEVTGGAPDPHPEAHEHE
jgi:hypothetical protein